MENILKDEILNKIKKLNFSSKIFKTPIRCNPPQLKSTRVSTLYTNVKR